MNLGEKNEVGERERERRGGDRVVTDPFNRFQGAGLLSNLHGEQVVKAVQLFVWIKEPPLILVGCRHVRHLLLEHLPLVYVLFQSAGSNQPVHADVALLPKPKGTVLRLQVVRRVPIRVKDDNLVRARNVKPDATGTR